MSGNKFNVLLNDDSDDEVVNHDKKNNNSNVLTNELSSTNNNNNLPSNNNNLPSNNNLSSTNTNNNSSSTNTNNNNSSSTNTNNNNSSSTNNLPQGLSNEMPTNKFENDLFQKYYKKQPITYDKQYFTKKPTTTDYSKNQYFDKKQETVKPPETQITKPNITVTNRTFDIENTLQQPLKVLAHHVIDITKWEISNFHYVTTLTKWEHIPSFCKSLKFDKGVSSLIDYDLYIMKEHITPLWENQWNKYGSICSIRIDSLPEAINLIQKLVTHMVNNSLINNFAQTSAFKTGMIQTKFAGLRINEIKANELKASESNLGETNISNVKVNETKTKEVNHIDSFNNVNGVSFTPKKISVLSSQQVNYYLIKIWLRANYSDKTPEKLLNEDVFNSVKKLSVKITPIKAEY